MEVTSDSLLKRTAGVEDHRPASRLKQRQRPMSGRTARTPSAARPRPAPPDPELVRGKRILVYDDVYTEGLTLREVARALRNAGAVEVSEVVLARQPYGGSQ